MIEADYKLCRCLRIYYFGGIILRRGVQTENVGCFLQFGRGPNNGKHEIINKKYKKWRDIYA